ncbi:MAG: YggT family protein, partial [Deltaproteobacteria bacterium]|nr:YggT family protein [Deltaproteobacteria bacterium]
MSSSTLMQLSAFIQYAVQIYIWIIIVRVLLTWVNPNPNTTFMVILGKITDPALNFAQRHFPLRLGGLDLSPIVLIILLSLGGSVISKGILLKAQNMPMS